MELIYESGRSMPFFCSTLGPISCCQEGRDYMFYLGLAEESVCLNGLLSLLEIFSRTSHGLGY